MIYLLIYTYFINISYFNGILEEKNTGTISETMKGYKFIYNCFNNHWLKPFDDENMTKQP